MAPRIFEVIAKCCTLQICLRTHFNSARNVWIEWLIFSSSQKVKSLRSPKNTAVLALNIGTPCATKTAEDLIVNIMSSKAKKSYL